jgi:hypothetical protein|tara:strand:+ start:1062 stop:1196 length:135 start_codon:yes stop_codon:yes gene_type:complete
MRIIVGILGTVCGIVSIAFFGWTSLLWPKWTDNAIESLQEWLDD